ncbi:MAG: hypothetical protein GW936_04985 [Gallionella sp.]|nr:hypothetical protein [Gallionella sp.]
MLQYKSVTVERLVCTCDRCGKAMDQQDDMMEWQERFIVSFRAGFGSVFGDGNAVEGDFCQDCIQAVLGKYLRVKLDDPFEPQHKLDSEPQRLLQPNQQKKVEQAERLQAELLGIVTGTDERVVTIRKLASRLGIPAAQVADVAIEHMLRATEHLEKPKVDTANQPSSE